MASAAAQLFVQVTANVRGLIDGFDAARQAAGKLGDGVDRTAGTYTDAAEKMRDASSGLAGGMSASQDAADRLSGSLANVASDARNAAEAANSLSDSGSRSFGGMIAGAATAALKIGAIGAAAYLVVKNWSTIGPALSGIFSSMRGGAGTAFDRIKQGAGVAASGISSAFASAKDKAISGFQSLAAGVSSIFSKIPASIKAIGITAPLSLAFRALEGRALGIGTILAGSLGANAITAIFSGLSGGVLNASREMLQLASDLEQTRISFTTMTGSAAKADSLLRDLASFAQNTPFELTGLVDSSKKLMAFGFDAKAILPVMNAVGNAVAAVGGGKDTLDGVTRALGQMAAKGKVSAEEMQQLAERGIPAWRMLAEGIGVSTPEAMKRAEKGAIDANTAIVAILNGMNKRFPDMMAKQSQTFAGAMSNLQDVTKQTMTRIGQSLIDAFNLTAVIRNVTTAIQNLTDAFYSGGLIAAINIAFGPSAKAMVIALGVTITGAMIPALVSAAAALVPIAAGFVAAAAASAPLIAAGLAVGAAAYVIMRQWDNLAGLYLNVVADMAQATTWFRNSAAKIWNDIGGFVGRKLMEINGYIREVFGVDLAAKMGVGVGKIGQGFSEISMWASEKMGIVRDAFSYAADDIAANFTYAFNQGAAASKMAFGKITADTLGLPKVTQAATTAAAKHHKTAAQIAREHAAEAKRVEAQYMRNLQTYLAQEAVTYKLGAGLKKLEADQARLGLAFDAAGAKAELYRSVLSQIEQAFGKASRQAMATRTAIAELQAASDNGGAALAKAYEIIGKAGAGLDLAQRQAEALGQAFDRNAEGVKLYEQAIKDLVEMGLKPGNKAYDEAIAKLNGLRSAAAQAVNANVELGKSIGDVAGPIGTIINGATDMFELFGIKIPDGAKDTISGFIKFGQVIGSVAGAIPMLTQALAGLNVAIATNPIGLLIVAIGAGLYLWSKTIGFIIDRFNEANEAGASAMRNTAAEITAARQEAFNFAADISLIPQHFTLIQEQIKGIVAIAGEAFSTLRSAAESGLKDATLAFMAGASNYGEILRTKLREGITQAVLDAIIKQQMMGNIEKLIKQITDAFASGNLAGIDALYKQLEEKLIKATEAAAGTMGVVAKALGEVPEQFAAMANKATSSARSMRSAMEDRNREAMGSYHQNMLNTVQRLANAGAQDPGSRLHNQYLVALDEANKASNDLRRMATGGLVTGPTLARMGEGGRPEAVLPLNENVYRQIGQGIAAARDGGGQAVVSVNYYGSGKWTREDAEGLGRLLVSELRALGVRA